MSVSLSWQKENSVIRFMQIGKGEVFPLSLPGAPDRKFVLARAHRVASRPIVRRP